MINFIICDDNKEFSEKIRKIIKNYMMNFDIVDKFYMYEDYSDKFKSEIKEIEGFKLYILDIETKCNSGIDAARYIREELADWNSLIIFLTAHNELKFEALSNRLYLLDFINKFDNYENKLKEDLERVKKNYDNREKCLTFESNRVIKRIDFKNIVIIEKEKDSKKCIVKATYGDYVIHKTLNEVFKLLDKRFIKTSRSSIVNVDQISEYDYSENKILFKNGIVTFDISRNNKKKVCNSVKSYR